MKFVEKNPPRTFTVGAGQSITIADCGEVYLKPDEQVTFKTDSGTEYDLSRKDWGYYATPSLNGRLQQFSLRGVLIKNVISKRYFVLLVERGKEESFQEYLKKENLKVITWLDEDQVLESLERTLTEAKHG